MKLKELPPHVRKIALQRAKDDKHWANWSDHRILGLNLASAFLWRTTPETYFIWDEIDTHQNYEPFNNFHKIKK